MKLYNGDCLEIMKEIPDKSIDLILTDPPYGTTACKWDSVIPFDKLWEQYNRLIKDNGAIVLFGSEPFASALRMSNIKNYKYEWYWDKQNAGNILSCNKMPLKVIENIIVFNTHTYYPQMAKRTEEEKKIQMAKNKHRQKRKSNITKAVFIDKSDCSYKYPQSLLHFNARQNETNNINRVHPTQKPVVLLEYLIKTYTKENEIVLDNCMGSGSTGVACVNTNRDFIGIELDKNYFEIAKKRIEEAEKDVKSMLFDLC